jgi:DNA (cytosine-5)-methyltransferase 1
MLISRETVKPRALDLFCGAGGASMGLHQAGFDVTGIDIRPMKRYPFRFIQADALQPPVRLEDFDLIWASPPCQAHTALRKMWNAREHKNQIPQTRELLEAGGRPYVIENVPGAPLRATIRLCGSNFGLGVKGAELRRHRWFESSFGLLAPPCTCGKSTTIGIYGEGARDISSDARKEHVRDRCRTITVTGHTPQQNVVRNQIRKTYSVEDARKAMGINWMTIAELCEAIPPAYAEYIGGEALRQQKGLRW